MTQTPRSSSVRTGTSITRADAWACAWCHDRVPGVASFAISPIRLDSSAAKDDEDAAAHAVQHLRAYLDARELKAQALIVADEDASISALGDGFDRAHMGRPEEFDSFLLSPTSIADPKMGRALLR